MGTTHPAKEGTTKQANRVSELGFLVFLFIHNHFTPSQTHPPRAAESKQ